MLGRGLVFASIAEGRPHRAMATYYYEYDTERAVLVSSNCSDANVSRVLLVSHVSR